MIQQTTHHFSNEEIQFLNRGPTYIVPGQMHLFYTYQTLETTLTQQLLVPLRKQLLQVFTRLSLDLARQQTFRRAIEQQFINSFSISIPNNIKQYAMHQLTLLQSIQTKLKEDKLILRRTADNYNIFYLDRADHFHQLSQSYIDTNPCFELIGTFDQNIPNAEEKFLQNNIQSIHEILDIYHRKKLIHSIYFEKLVLINKPNLKLPYLYFLPISEQVLEGNTILRTRLSSCRNAPIRTLIVFLDRLLRPLYENASQSTRLLDGHDFISKLEFYCQHGNRFNSNIQFATFELHNIYTRLTHNDLLDGLNEFLVRELPSNRYQWLSIETIINLVKVTLKHHVFTYQGQVYRYKKGCPLNYTFTQLLFDIYLHYWQNILVRHIRLTDQFYGRYHHLGIFTMNESDEDLHIRLKELNDQNPDVPLTITRDYQIHFLDVYIANENGILHTHVYRNMKIQPFLLPYSAEHPRKLHRQWFRFRVARAVQYCPSFHDFQDEYLEIKLTFLANGYSMEFIQFLWTQFIQRFKPFNYVYIHNAMNYKALRQQVFRYYFMQKANAKRDYEQERLTTLPTSISFYYLFDWGNRIEFNQKFLKLWSEIVMKDKKFAEFALKMSIRCKHCYSLHSLFVRNRQ